MRIVVADDHEAMSELAAAAFAQVVRERPDANFMPATGNTPMRMYEKLAELRMAGEIDFSGLNVFQLDAYRGVGPDDFRSLYGWMMKSLVTPLGIPEGSVLRLAGDAEDPDLECADFERRVSEAGGIDITVLGLGPNGHLGFNEPPSTPDAPTRRIPLTPESLVSNSVYWGGPDQVPTEALTAGMTLLLAARQVMLVVSGERKREILERTVFGPVTPDNPASYLQTVPNAVVFTDRAAWGDRPIPE
jgi:glucosamine-6-phosphate deaminase